MCASPDPPPARGPGSRGLACPREAAYGSPGAWRHQGKPLTQTDSEGSGRSAFEPWKPRVLGPLFGETEFREGAIAAHSAWLWRLEENRGPSFALVAHDPPVEPKLPPAGSWCSHLDMSIWAPNRGSDRREVRKQSGPVEGFVVQFPAPQWALLSPPCPSSDGVPATNGYVRRADPPGPPPHPPAPPGRGLAGCLLLPGPAH